MAHHKSAKKRIRSDARKNAANHSYISSVRTAVKKFRSAVEKGESVEGLKTLMTSAQSLVDRAAKRGILHKNAASRKIKRMSHMLTKFEAGELTLPKSAPKKKKKVQRKKPKK